MKIIFRIGIGLLAVICAMVAGFVALYRAPDKPVAELQSRWAPPPLQFIDVAGMSVHLRDEGPRDDPLLTNLRVPRCVLAGNSLGGQISIAMALAHPERVERLILVDSSGYPLAPASIPIGFRLARIPLVNKILEVTLPRSVVEATVRDVYGDPARVTQEVVDRYFELTLRTGNRRALVERLKQVSADAISDQIPRVKIPTLILWGRLDRWIPPEAAGRFQRDIAGSRLILFEDLGHVPQEEDPLRTLAVVKEFLGIQ